MSRLIRKTSLLVVLLCLMAPFSFAEITQMGWENSHTFRVNIRSDNDDYDFYLTRIKTFLNYALPQSGRVIKIAPFFEYQSNFNTNTWWRKETGLEIGSSFFNDSFYYGASLQHVWQKEENYPVELLDETTEWESRFVISPPIRWGIFKDKVRLHLFNEYTFDLNRGQGTVNEMGASLDWQALEGLTIPLGWRHVDRVHDFDNDFLEFSVVFSF